MKQGVFHRGCFIGVFHRGVSEVVAPKRICVISGSHVFARFLFLEDKSPEGPPQPDSSSEISAEDGLDVCVLISNDDVGQTSFPGGCFIGVFHRGVSYVFHRVFHRGVS